MLKLSKRNKKLLVVLIIAIMVLAAGVLVFAQVTKINNSIKVKDSKINELQQTITTIGDLVTAYVVRADVVAGKEIEETDLEPVDIPLAMTSALVTNINDIKGKYYKIDMTKGSVLSIDMVIDSEMDNSMRLFDVVTDENPLGLKPGAYVDIRISMPFGEDFIAMTNKRVHSINSDILKLAITENDIHTYNSMLVDKILYPGTRIYAVEYAEPGGQVPATVYYPVSKNVLAIVQKDPNLINSVKQDMIDRRTQLETSLQSAINPEIADILQEGKQTITDTIDVGNKELQKRLADEEKERKKQEALAAKQSAQPSSTSSGDTNSGVVN